MAALNSQWRLAPPLRVIAAAWAGYKPPEPPRQFDEQAVAELAQLMPAVAKHVPIDTGAWEAFLSDQSTRH